MITSLIGAIALLKMDKAEQLVSIRGEFGIEAEPDIDDEEPESEPELDVSETSETDEPEEADA